ncbi:hypothetical protein LJC49_08835 [Ruminococcaceae bacterium OttesenSCG-928-I18]|nr:hypothetical protein [Ruminococcaceae bacterium OttesenSCG-928-I18]
MAKQRDARLEAQAYRNAIGILLAGFVLALFTIELAGIDILLDAVGWLLVFNGVRPLERPEGGIGPRAALALGLVAVSALQLFFTEGMPAVVLAGARAGLEIVFFLLLIGLFRRILHKFGQSKTAGVMAFLLAVNAVAAVFWVLRFALPATAAVLTAVGAVTHVLLVLGLLWVLLCLRSEK